MTATPAAGAALAGANLAKLAGVRSGDLARRYQPGPAVINALRHAPTADAALRLLVEGGAVEAAIELLSQALPRREAVWWAATCVRDTLPEPPPAGEARLLDVSEAWVRRPGDEARRAAYALANAEGVDSPGGLVAMATFFSGDSLAPAGQQAVPPPAHVAGAMVGNAIRLAAVRVAPEKAAERFARYLEIGIDIASGGSGRKRQSEEETAP
ncbi:DUF6931 family protein [Zavarzinia compransoris]|uniref:Uncharacterized protein n=1 Tax=Zavarzinia compransoris TaxID=1264899 RepID=A0A317E5J5_9PROT|nr:hypothetical protein [Zavarzinia compransoris]PWR22337.1 hypothetical protein DKG75_10315 [Zavarzinia compransoris]TDP46897.1 hypothetical protein DES42_10363 [Zavarzinia compransoris]